MIYKFKNSNFFHHEEMWILYSGYVHAKMLLLILLIYTKKNTEVTLTYMQRA